MPLTELPIPNPNTPQTFVDDVVSEFLNVINGSPQGILRGEVVVEYSITLGEPINATCTGNCSLCAGNYSHFIRYGI